MTIDFAYVKRSVDAAFDLVARNPRAWTKFDLTTDGFYRSFAAFLIVAPINIATDLIVVQLAAAERTRQNQPVGEAVYYMSDAVFSTLALCVQWLLFPLAMLFLLRFLGYAQRYAALIIAHNWGSVIVWLFNLPAFLLFAAGFITSNQAIDLNLIVLGFTLYYRFYIAQTALGAPWTVAIGIAMIDFLLQANFLFALRAIAGLWLPA